MRNHGKTIHVCTWIIWIYREMLTDTNCTEFYGKVIERKGYVMKRAKLYWINRNGKKTVFCAQKQDPPEGSHVVTLTTDLMLCIMEYATRFGFDIKKVSLFPDGSFDEIMDSCRVSQIKCGIPSTTFTVYANGDFVINGNDWAVQDMLCKAVEHEVNWKAE